MSTCFFPVAASLRVGDQIDALSDVRFGSPRTVVGFEAAPDGMRAVLLSAGSGTAPRLLVVPAEAQASPTPPF